MNFESMISAYLMSTHIKRGEFHEDPFLVDIQFYQDNKQAHDFFTDKKTGDEKQQKVLEYLETVINKKVDLRFTLLDEKGEAKTLEELGFSSMTSPRELFMQDMEQEPALKLLVELFHAEHITTKRTTS
ncbi:MAG: hypothetical protein OCD01_12485 [Fibrobacterales bacterium]